jgi:hypothetical protein
MIVASQTAMALSIITTNLPPLKQFLYALHTGQSGASFQQTHYQLSQIPREDKNQSTTNDENMGLKVLRRIRGIKPADATIQKDISQTVMLRRSIEIRKEVCISVGSRRHDEGTPAGQQDDAG